MKVRVPVLLAVLAFLPLPHGLADTLSEPWIAKARAAIGPEAALEAVRSIHFTGTLDTTETVPDPADATKTVTRPLHLAIDIIFQKPYQQRQLLRSEKISRATTLDGYDGWVQRVPDLAVPQNWLLDLMPVAEIKRLRANTWENLNFFRGIEQRGGSVKFLGEATVDGRPSVKLLFAHDADIFFTRYFDKATGRLLKTETENGGEIREEGEFLVGGLRFPRKLTSQAPGGQTTVITFETIILNETFPTELFAVPTLMAR